MISVATIMSRNHNTNDFRNYRLFLAFIYEMLPSGDIFAGRFSVHADMRSPLSVIIFDHYHEFCKSIRR